MRIIKPLIILLLLALVAGGGTLGYFYKKGYFEDPQVALRELTERGITPDSASAHQAALAGDVATIEILKRAEVTLTETDDEQRTLLHHAIDQQNEDLFTFVQGEKGFDYDARDLDGNTPLSLSLAQGNLTLAKQLIASGANPNVTLPSGELALPAYLKAGETETLSFLLESGANPDSPSLEGETPLSMALQRGQTDLACLFLEKGANAQQSILGEPSVPAIVLNQKKWKLSPEDSQRILSTLLVSGASPESLTSKKNTALQLALHSDLRGQVELLLPRTENISGSLWLAIQKDNLKATAALLTKGASVEKVGPEGDTPLIYAIRNNKSELLDLLLQHKANPRQSCPEGQPALFFATAIHNTDAAFILLATLKPEDLETEMTSPVSEKFRALFGSKGLFDWYCRNETGLTPLMAATMLKNLPLAEHLVEMGADRLNGTRKGVYPIQMAATNSDVKMQQMLLLVPYADEEQERKFVIDLSEQKVRYYKNGELIKTSRVSTGRSGYRTPPGEYVITDKTRHKKSNIYAGSLMPYFQRFSCKAIGFHEGYTGSSYASHGCIRLPRSTAQYFWGQTSLGDRVTIQK